jgi:hypothetical protein
MSVRIDAIFVESRIEVVGIEKRLGFERVFVAKGRIAAKGRITAKGRVAAARGQRTC